MQDAKELCVIVQNWRRPEKRLSAPPSLIPCLNKCKDDDQVRSFFFNVEDIKAHLERDCPNRDYECQYCGKKGTYASITIMRNRGRVKRSLALTLGALKECYTRT